MHELQFVMSASEMDGVYNENIPRRPTLWGRMRLMACWKHHFNMIWFCISQCTWTHYCNSIDLLSIKTRQWSNPWRCFLDLYTGQKYFTSPRQSFVIVSDISSGSIYGIYNMTFYLTFYSDILSGIFSDILSAILSGIHSGIHSGILSGILSDILFWHFIWDLFRHSFPTFFLPFFLPFFLASILAFFLAFFSGILSGIYSGILSGIYSGILSGILSDILFWHSVWHSFLAFYLASIILAVSLTWAVPVPTEWSSVGRDEDGGGRKEGDKQLR